MDNTISVEVAYARADMQRILVVEVPVGVKAREVLRASGLVDLFPEIDTASCPIGVFGEPVSDSYLVQSGDRVEVYRPLTIDPREARREFASRGMTMGDKPESET